VPNIDALVNRVMREKGATFGGHSHIQFFNVKTLSMLLEKAGFEIKEYDTVITELGTINNYLSFKDPYFAENADMLEFITPEAIYKNYLGSSLHMIGKLR